MAGLRRRLNNNRASKNACHPTHLRRLARVWVRFQRDRRGDVAIIFALALIPILAFVGAAVDYSRANAMRADLQAALDSTALMVSKNAATQTGSALQTSAQNYFNALFNNTQAQNLQFTASYSSSGGSSVAVNASADMPTTFMAILGFKTLTVTGSSTAKWGSVRLRVALVLDNTGSMADDGKMAALQTATKNLLTQLQTAATTNGDVYVSIIPVAKDVNVGAANYATSWENWIDWTPMAPANSVPSASVGPGSACPYSSYIKRLYLRHPAWRHHDHFRRAVERHVSRRHLPEQQHRLLRQHAADNDDEQHILYRDVLHLLRPHQLHVQRQRLFQNLFAIDHHDHLSARLVHRSDQVERLRHRPRQQQRTSL